MSARAMAIVGATGAVGQDLLTVLAQRQVPLRSLRLFASPRSAGQRVTFGGEELLVEPLRAGCFRGVELALFSAGADVSREYAPQAVASGAIVIDNSSAFRLAADVPLVVPEVNAEAAAGHRGIVANPNCSTILLVLALWPLHQVAGLRAVLVSTYQAASGAGQQAVLELRASTAAALRGERLLPRVLPHSLAFNVFPQVDAFMPDGYTKEEDKLQFETRKILGLPTLPVEATCVRVPVERCHSEAVAVHLQRPLAVATAQALLAGAPGLQLVDEPAQGIYPMPLSMAGQDAVAVGRIRQGRVFAPGLTFWLAGDQLRKGAALNAVQIAELC